MGGDLRYAVRTLRQSPGFVLTAVLVLAIGVGASTAAFSFVNGVFFRPLAVHEAERMVRLYAGHLQGPRYFTLGPADYREVTRLTRVFSGALADEPVPMHFGASGTVTRVWGYNVSGNYFTLLGLRPALGRFFLPEEVEAPDRPPVVVLSEGFWRRQFAADPHIVGTEVTLGGRPFTVVGVAPRGFHGVNVGLKPELFVPVRVEDRGERGYFVMARLAPGITVREAQAAVDVLARQLERVEPLSRRGLIFSVLPALEGSVHPLVRNSFVGFSAALTATMSLVLLLACANVAGLMLARAAQRRRQIAVRLAVGASRLRIVRQLLAESALVWLIAGGAGTGLAWGAVRVLVALPLPTDRPLFIDIAMDPRVLAFSIGATVLTGLLFGLVPAVSATRTDVVEGLRDGGRALGFRSPLRSGLLASQVALCLVLLIGASLSARSLANAHAVPLGFTPEGVAMASLDLEGYDLERSELFWRELRARLSVAPGVESVGLSNRVPFELNVIRLAVEAPGEKDRGLPAVDFAVVDRGYFETLRVPLLQGRVFAADDTRGPEVVINETLARLLWPEGRALEQPVVVGGTRYRVAGIVNDGKYLTLGEEETPFVYLPFWGQGTSVMTLLVRGSAAPGQGSSALLLSRLRREIAGLDPTLPVYNLKTLQEHLAIALVPAGGGAWLLGSFGGMALLLVCVGLHGLLAHAVAQRTHEIGIRRALGAQDRDVVGLVMGQAMLPVLAGVVAGLGLGLVVSPALRSLLYGIGPDDPLSHLGAASALLVTAAVACGIPASRAAQIEPMAALRQE